VNGRATSERSALPQPRSLQPAASTCTAGADLHAGPHGCGDPPNLACEESAMMVTHWAYFVHRVLNNADTMGSTIHGLCGG
jgi:hypothetical protein